MRPEARAARTEEARREGGEGEKYEGLLFRDEEKEEDEEEEEGEGKKAALLSSATTLRCTPSGSRPTSSRLLSLLGSCAHALPPQSGTSPAAEATEEEEEAGEEEAEEEEEEEAEEETEEEEERGQGKGRCRE